MEHRGTTSQRDRLPATARANGLPEPPLLTADARSSVDPRQPPQPQPPQPPQPRHAWEHVDMFTVVTQAGLQHHVLLRCPRCGQYWARAWGPP